MFETILKRVSRVAEFIAAMILAAIFIIFLLQIFTRYAPKIAWLMPIPPIHDWMMALEPIGWTVNLISLLWVWLIFFGCAFFVRESDHVAFDVFFQALSRSWQRYFAMATALIMVVAMPVVVMPMNVVIMAVVFMIVMPMIVMPMIVGIVCVAGVLRWQRHLV